MDFYVTNLPPPLDTGIESKFPISTYNAKEFKIRESSGLPSEFFKIFLSDTMKGLDLTLNSLEFYGAIKIRWEIVLNDGKRLTKGDADEVIAEGNLSSSPYFVVVGLISTIPRTMFVGEYEVNQESGTGVSDAFPHFLFLVIMMIVMVI